MAIKHKINGGLRMMNKHNNTPIFLSKFTILMVQDEAKVGDAHELFRKYWR